MSLKKDDVVELIEKDDNGWWLVKMNGAEGWAPNNYLELVPPKAASAPPAPPPPRRAPPPKVEVTPSVASVSAKPVSVFPGMAPSNGSATPWKITPSNSNDNSAANSRPPSASSKSPPPVAAKPKPPAVGAKPVAGKPAIPTAPRPVAAPPPKAKGSVGKPPTAPGQVDLAAAVSLFGFVILAYIFFSRSSRNVLKELRKTTNTKYTLTVSYHLRTFQRSPNVIIAIAFLRQNFFSSCIVEI